MNARGLFLLLAALAAASPTAAAEVAILKSSATPAWDRTLDALRRSLSGHTVSEHDLAGDPAQADRVLATLKGREVIFVTLGPLAAQAARKADPGRPLAYAYVANPQAVGLDGAAGVAFGLPIKNQFAAFRLVHPGAVRIGVVHGPATAAEVQEATGATRLLRLALIARPVASDKEVPEALRNLLGGDNAVDALWLPADPLLLGDDVRRFVLAETLKKNKPVFAFSESLIAEGALASDAADQGSVGEVLAQVVGRLAAGEAPTKVGVQVARGRLAINGKIARKLGITIPQQALEAAAQVY